MANECLVTKLKGTVDNDNLPKFNIMSFDYDASHNYSAGGATQLTLRAGGSAVTVRFKVPFHVGTASGSTVSERTIQPNTAENFYINRSELGLTNIKGIIEVDNMYNVTKCLVIPAQNGIIVNGARSNAISFLKYSSNPIMFGGEILNAKDFVANIYYYHLISTDVDNNYSNALSIDNIGGNNTKCQVLFGYANTVTFKYFNLDERTRNNTTLRYLSIAPKGAITDLPINIKDFNIQSNDLVGSIEDLIAKFNAAGRTSGVVALENLAGATAVTYNGKSLSAMISDGDIAYFPGTSRIEISWTGNTITFLTTPDPDLQAYIISVGNRASWVPEV